MEEVVSIKVNMVLSAWESLQRSAKRRGIDPEQTLTIAFGVLELVDNTELYTKDGARFGIKL
jgi:hypothetical protein